MSILEICAIIAIPAGFVGLIAQSFLSAHIKEVGIKTAWKNILSYALFTVWIGCIVIGVFLQIINIRNMSSESLKVIDVISICMTIISVFLSIIIAIIAWAFKRLVDGHKELYKIINNLDDRIKELREKN